jgi:antitoxin CptB
MTGPDAGAAAGAERLRRLRWRARRGLLENDLLLTRFIDRHGAALSADAGRMRTLMDLLELPDGELLDLLLGRSEPEGALDTPRVRELLALVRSD